MGLCLGVLLAGVLLTDAAAAQDPAEADKLAGQVQTPLLSPSDADVVAYGRLFQDAQELYLYNRRTGAVDRVQVRKDGATGPVETSFARLFEAQNLDQFSRYDGQLSWRPRLDARGRQWFAFVSGGETGFDVYLSYLDARGRLATEPPTRLAYDGLEQFPQWSPDGRHLVFVSGNESGSDLYLMRDVGALMARRGDAFQPVRLTANPDLEAHPAWSPDGRYVAYQTLAVEEGRQNWGISVVRLADQVGRSVPQPVRLTGALSEYDEFKPSWAPDGQHLAFYVSQARVGEGGDNLQQDIGVVGIVRSSGLDRIVRGRLLTGFSPRPAVNVLPHANRGPSWMPVEDALLLVHVKRDAQARFPIYVTDFRRWQGRQPGYEQPLSDEFGTQYHRDPVLAALPDGIRVAFVSQEGGVNKVQVFDRPGPPGATRAVTIPVEKSKSAALTRSLFVPGLGQFYKEQPAKGWLFLAAEAASLGAAVVFTSQVDTGELSRLEAAYQQSVAQPGGCPGGFTVPCENAAFAAWQDEYDRARSRQTLALAAAGVAVGVWALNLIDSASGFPRTVERPVRIAGARVRVREARAAGPDGASRAGLRLLFTF